MVTRKEQDTARNYIPEHPTLRKLQQAAEHCKACELYKLGTQTVFGEGRLKSRIMLIGEQPGNDEDLAGKPFVGPAGKLLDKALAAAGIDRADAYVSNVVKHFKWEPKGKLRLHKKPSAREVGACLPWLEEEIALIKPEILVLLGATAAQALLGKDFRVTKERGKIFASPFAASTMATVHPSSILRQRSSEEREREFDHFVQDLTVVADFLS